MMTRTSFPLQKPQTSKALQEKNLAVEIASCALNRRSENVIIKAVIIAELKFSDIERKIFALILRKERTMPRLKMLQSLQSFGGDRHRRRIAASRGQRWHGGMYHCGGCTQ